MIKPSHSSSALVFTPVVLFPSSYPLVHLIVSAHCLSLSPHPQLSLCLLFPSPSCWKDSFFHVVFCLFKQFWVMQHIAGNYSSFQRARIKVTSFRAGEMRRRLFKIGLQRLCFPPRCGVCGRHGAVLHFVSDVSVMTCVA